MCVCVAVICEHQTEKGLLSVPQCSQHPSCSCVWPWPWLCAFVCLSGAVCVQVCVCVWPEEHSKLLSLRALCCGGDEITSQQHSYFQSSTKQPSLPFSKACYLSLSAILPQPSSSSRRKISLQNGPPQYTSFQQHQKSSWPGLKMPLEYWFTHIQAVYKLSYNDSFSLLCTVKNDV